jgi:hypothetical protein
METKKDWYWVGIVRTDWGRDGVNGPIPFSTADPPGCYPPASEWLGFATLGEAVDAGRLLLHASAKNVKLYMHETFPSLLDEGKVAYRRP